MKIKSTIFRIFQAHLLRTFGFFLGTLFWALSASAQISPGELSKAHAEFEGMKNCVKCHVLGESPTNEKCLDCHSDISEMIAEKRGLHANSEIISKNCFECHNEHHGRDFDMIHFEQESFDHELTGYTLQGAHADLECNKCHQPELISNEELKAREHTYLGLSTECVACHTDHHLGNLGADCMNCHNQEAFAPAPGFDHQETEFPLIGKHGRIECEACHETTLKEDNSFQKFEKITVANCTDCHEDIHKGSQGNDCLKCHNQESFRQLSNLDDFDHNNTDFPLIGQHQKVNCKECHKQAYTQALAHTNCYDCHDDYHEGQLNSGNTKPDCNKCHNEKGFTPALFTIEMHQNSAFELEGAHLATPCVFCHLKNEKWAFRKIGNNCVDCHEDIHEKYLSEKYYPKQNCLQCHNTDAWDVIGFDHKLTAFALLGQHEKASCRDCHFNESEQKFSALNQRCEQCHDDIHYGQFASKYDNKCELCHEFENWVPNLFEHDSTRFKLEDGHANVACINCHEPVNEEGHAYINYQYDEIKCALCHVQ